MKKLFVWRGVSLGACLAMGLSVRADPTRRIDPLDAFCARKGFGNADPTAAFAKLPRERVMAYRQKDYRFHDPMADYSLGIMLDVTLKQIQWSMFAPEKLEEFRRNIRAARAEVEREPGMGAFDPEPNQYHAAAKLAEVRRRRALALLTPSLKDAGLETEAAEAVRERILSGDASIEGERNPIRVDAFVAMLLQVIREESSRRPPRAGEIHAWSDEYRCGHYRRALFRGSKLLGALGRGDTWRYLRTNHDDAFRAWLSQQAPYGVSPDKLFREAYRRADGDVYLALLSIQNVFARYWTVPKRDDLKHVASLAPVFHQLGVGADHMGPLYHFWGMVLYGYAEGAIASSLIGRIEGIGSQIMSRGVPERQEDHANLTGGWIGAALRKAVAKGAFLSDPPNAQATGASSYLSGGESFGPGLRRMAKNPDLKGNVPNR